MDGRLLVKKLMKERGIRTVDIASKGDCSFASVTQWLAGKDVTEDTFAKFAKGLGISVQELQRLVESGETLAAG